MKILKRILVVLLVLVVIALIVPAFFSGHSHVERSTTIYAPAENIYSMVANLKDWRRWESWSRMDPNMKITYTGPDQGIGSSYAWESQLDSVGSGSMTVTAAFPGDSLQGKLVFKDQGEATVTYRFKRTGDSTKITGMFDSDVPYLFRVFSAMMKGYLEEKFDQSLKTLKGICESGPKQTTYAVVESQQNEQPYISIRDTCTMATIGGKYMKNFPALFAACAKSSNDPAGPPFAIVHSDTAMTVLDIEWCIPVSKPATATADFKAGTLRTGPIIKADYYGPYEKTAPAYAAMQQWLAAKGKKATGPYREIYITDPSLENGKMDRVLTIIVADVN